MEKKQCSIKCMCVYAHKAANKKKEQQNKNRDYFCVTREFLFIYFFAVMVNAAGALIAYKKKTLFPPDV